MQYIRKAKTKVICFSGTFLKKKKNECERANIFILSVFSQCFALAYCADLKTLEQQVKTMYIVINKISIYARYGVPAPPTYL